MNYKYCFTKNDGTQIELNLSAYSSYTNSEVRWVIQNLLYKPKRKRNFVNMNTELRESFDGTGITSKEKEELITQGLINFAGKNNIEKALYEAWEAIKPDISELGAAY